MSADNYGIIHRLPNGDGWGVSMFFASEGWGEERWPEDFVDPMFEGTRDECEAWAANEWFEYGYSEWEGHRR